ncbi:hypothetical protein [Rhizobium mongolense]|uniref:hypothetical protein n=1 Tax=Rhizobium mongolense TaxID=57676 RepID=UPI001428D005|nr:hypothetical protein [Rhizobium mongolense]
MIFGNGTGPIASACFRTEGKRAGLVQIVYVWVFPAAIDPVTSSSFDGRMLVKRTAPR